MTYDVFLLILKCHTDSSSLVHSPLAVLPGATSTILSIHITIFYHKHDQYGSCSDK